MAPGTQSIHLTKASPPAIAYTSNELLLAGGLSRQWSESWCRFRRLIVHTFRPPRQLTREVNRLFRSVDGVLLVLRELDVEATVCELNNRNSRRL